MTDLADVIADRDQLVARCKRTGMTTLADQQRLRQYAAQITALGGDPLASGDDVIREVAGLYHQHGRWPTLDEFADAFHVQPSDELAQHLRALENAVRQLMRAVANE